MATRSSVKAYANVVTRRNERLKGTSGTSGTNDKNPGVAANTRANEARAKKTGTESTTRAAATRTGTAKIPGWIRSCRKIFCLVPVT